MLLQGRIFKIINIMRQMKRILILSAVHLMGLGIVFAQSAMPQITAVRSDLVGEAKGAAYNETLAQGTDTFSITVAVLLEDTSGVSKLYFEMIDKSDNNIYISQIYDLQTNTISGSHANATAEKTGNEYAAMLGHYWNISDYKIKVRAKYINGTFSAYTEY